MTIPLSIWGINSTNFPVTDQTTSFTPPTSLTTYPSDSKVLLQWAIYLNSTDYIIEYKLSSESDWEIYEDGISTTPGTTVLGLTNGTSYDFRVSTVVNTIQSEPSNPVSATPSTSFNNSFLNQILSTGQSLALGAQGTPPLSDEQPFSNKMFNSTFSKFIPLKEPATGTSKKVETMSSGMANMLSHLTKGVGTQVSSNVTLSAVGGAPYLQLKKGTAIYKNSITRMKTARNLSNASLIPYRINAITTIHGEADEDKRLLAGNYASYLKQWQQDYETDSKLITGQDGTIPLFLCQMSSWTAYSHKTPTTAIGQLLATTQNPSKIFLVTPKYIFDYSNGAHLTNYSYRKLGEYYGKVIKKVLVDNQEWKPLTLESATINDNIITAKFIVPEPPLQFDEKNVVSAKNYGFEFFDQSNSASIVNVAITGPKTVTITLNQIPTGKNMKLAYAYTGVAGAKPGRNNPEAPKGNLCDSDPTPTYYDYTSSNMENTLKNWCVTFIEPIINVTKPSLECYETATFNPNTNQWEVTDTKPVRPTLACYQSTTFNTNTCQWDITGTKPEQPVLACYQSTTFNTNTCQWDIAGTKPEQPALVDYESATFNTNTCQWEITSTSPSNPSLEIKNENNESSIKIYVNQFSDEIIIQNTENKSEIKFTLYDFNGKELINDKINSKATVNISNLSRGIYFLKLTTDEGVLIKKFLKV